MKKKKCVFDYSTCYWLENTLIIKYIKLIEMRILHFEVLKLKKCPFFMNIHYKYPILSIAIVLIILHIQYIFSMWMNQQGAVLYH